MAGGKLYWTESDMKKGDFFISRLDIKDRVNVVEREKIDPEKIKFKKKFPKMQLSKCGDHVSLYSGENKCEY